MAVKKLKNKKKKAVKTKKVKKITVKKVNKAKEGKLIGRITHYFSNIEVAVIKLALPLKVGEKIRIMGGEATDFEQKIKSMQIDHEAVKTAKKGSSVGVKVEEKVHEGYKVFKI